MSNFQILVKSLLIFPIPWAPALNTRVFQNCISAIENSVDPDQLISDEAS